MNEIRARKVPSKANPSLRKLLLIPNILCVFNVLIREGTIAIEIFNKLINAITKIRIPIASNDKVVFILPSRKYSTYRCKS